MLIDKEENLSNHIETRLGDDSNLLVPISAMVQY
jgi:hypothetical protein